MKFSDLICSADNDDDSNSGGNSESAVKKFGRKVWNALKWNSSDSSSSSGETSQPNDLPQSPVRLDNTINANNDLNSQKGAKTMENTIQSTDQQGKVQNPAIRLDNLGPFPQGENCQVDLNHAQDSVNKVVNKNDVIQQMAKSKEQETTTVASSDSNQDSVKPVNKQNEAEIIAERKEALLKKLEDKTKDVLDIATKLCFTIGQLCGVENIWKDKYIIEGNKDSGYYFFKGKDAKKEKLERKQGEEWFQKLSQPFSDFDKAFEVYLAAYNDYIDSNNGWKVEKSVKTNHDNMVHLDGSFSFDGLRRECIKTRDFPEGIKEYKDTNSPIHLVDLPKIALTSCFKDLGLMDSEENISEINIKEFSFAKDLKTIEERKSLLENMKNNQDEADREKTLKKIGTHIYKDIKLLSVEKGYKSGTIDASALLEDIKDYKDFFANFQSKKQDLLAKINEAMDKHRLGNLPYDFAYPLLQDGNRPVDWDEAMKLIKMKTTYDSIVYLESFVKDIAEGKDFTNATESFQNKWNTDLKNYENHIREYTLNFYNNCIKNDDSKEQELIINEVSKLKKSLEKYRECMITLGRTALEQRKEYIEALLHQMSKLEKDCWRIENGNDLQNNLELLTKALQNNQELHTKVLKANLELFTEEDSDSLQLRESRFIRYFEEFTGILQKNPQITEQILQANPGLHEQILQDNQQLLAEKMRENFVSIEKTLREMNLISDKKVLQDFQANISTQWQKFCALKNAEEFEEQAPKILDNCQKELTTLQEAVDKLEKNSGSLSEAARDHVNRLKIAIGRKNDNFKTVIGNFGNGEKFDLFSKMKDQNYWKLLMEKVSNVESALSGDKKLEEAEKANAEQLRGAYDFWQESGLGNYPSQFEASLKDLRQEVEKLRSYHSGEGEKKQEEYKKYEANINTKLKNFGDSIKKFENDLLECIKKVQGFANIRSALESCQRFASQYAEIIQMSFDPHSASLSGDYSSRLVQAANKLHEKAENYLKEKELATEPDQIIEVIPTMKSRVISVHLAFESALSKYESLETNPSSTANDILSSSNYTYLEEEFSDLTIKM